MADQTGYFTAYWSTFYNHSMEFIWGVDKKIEFSEGLLQTLCYETDIGSIPRGNTLDTSTSKPKYFDSNNWNCLIQGCYWCSDSKLDILGFFCSKECLFYFHDWCVERIYFFTKRRFCRFPGCDKSSNKKTLYCDDTHVTEFIKVFPNWIDQHSLSKSILRDGPTWYKSKQPSNSCPKSGHFPNLSQQNSSVASPASQTQTYAKVVSSTKNQNSKKENVQDSKKALPGTTTKSVSDGKSSSDTKNSPVIKNNPSKPPQNAKPSGKKKKDECPYMDFPSEFKNLLIFETDIGIIPREKPTPIQLTSLYSGCPNWKRETIGCYFCGYNSKTNMGNDYFNTFRCYLIFYEWCRKKIKFFTGTDLCRLPGCVRPTSVGYDCCNKEHTLALQEIYGNVEKIDFEKMMEQGPCWYNKNDSPNWSAVIKGCYNCGNRDVNKFYKEMFCREPCQLVFYEWCRKKIERETSTTFCQLLGCPKYASDGFDCCNKEHSIIIQQKHTDCKNMDITRLINTPPSWYNRSLTPFESIPPTNQHSQVKTQYSPSHPPIQQSTQVVHPQFQYSGPHFLFSQQLTEFLYYNTDVGPIPREIQTFMPPAPLNLANQQNWLSAITQCYWCCASRPTFQGITCSDKCFFLLNEWLHNKFTNFSHIRLCRVLGCSYFASQGFQGCNREHSIKFESSFKKYFSLLKETEFNLGPAWYNDYSRILINFYHRKDPFYEFSNFYPCTNLYMSNINWKTSEHYFQASKFAGTPYFRYVSTCPAPRDAFKFARERAVQSWIRPDWHNVKLNVMYSVLVHKFQQDRDLLNILLRTGNAKIVDHTKNDKFWGDGGDGSGDNMLGTLLMRVRDRLREIHPNMAPQPNQQNIPIPNPIPCNHQNQSVIPATFSPSNTSPTHNTVQPQKLQMHSRDPPNSEDTKISFTNISKTTDHNTPNIERRNIQQPDPVSSTEQQVSGSISELKVACTDSDVIQSPKTLILTRVEAKRELPIDYKCPFNIPSSPFNDSEPSSPHDLGSSSNFSFNLAQVTAELQEQSVDSSSEHFSLSNPFRSPFENIPLDPREYRPSENTEEIVEPHYMTNQFYPPTSSSCLSDQPMTAECVNKLDTQRKDLPMEKDPSLTQGGFHFPNPCNENTMSVQSMTFPSHLHSPSPKEVYNGSEEDETMAS